MLSLDSLWSPEGVESLRIVHGETGEFTDTFYVQGREEQLYEHYYAFARTEAESN